MKLSVIIPVYNEVKTVGQVIESVLKTDALGLAKEMLIVDDGSSDGTAELLKSFTGQAKILSHASNQGKGAAIRTAQAHITGDIVIIQDADLEYDPREYGDLLRPIIEGRADVVFGSRLSGGKPTRAFKFGHYLGNKFLSTLTNVLYNSTLTDMETGFKVIKAEHFAAITIRSNRFDVEPELTAKLLKKSLRLYEMPISYYGRDYAEGKKITWKDGIFAVAALIRYRLAD